jgi:hypothetical protein
MVRPPGAFGRPLGFRLDARGAESYDWYLIAQVLLYQKFREILIPGKIYHILRSVRGTA